MGYYTIHHAMHSMTSVVMYSSTLVHTTSSIHYVQLLVEGAMGYYTMMHSMTSVVMYYAMHSIVLVLVLSV